MMKLNICGHNIRKRRLELGMTQEELAAALEVDRNVKLTRSNISAIENDHRHLKDFEVVDFAAVLETTFEKLVGAEGYESSK